MVREIAILCILIAASVTDIKRMEVPYKYIILIALTALIEFQAENLLGILVSVPFYYIERDGRSMGGGDTMMVAALGCSLGVAETASAVIIGCTIFIIVSFIAELIKGEKNKLFPFIPALSAGYIIAKLLEVLV